MHSIEYTVYSIDTRSNRKRVDRVYSLLDRPILPSRFTKTSIENKYHSIETLKSSIEQTCFSIDQTNLRKQTFSIETLEFSIETKLSKSSRSRHSSSRSRQTHRRKTVSCLWNQIKTISWPMLWYHLWENRYSHKTYCRIITKSNNLIMRVINEKQN